MIPEHGPAGPPSHHESARQSYPPYSRSATTFAELFNAYLMTWPQAHADASSGQWPDHAAYCEYLFKLAERVTAEFPAADVWDHLDDALRHSMTWYDPRKGPFDKLFEANLRERLGKSAARTARAASRRIQAEEAHARDRERRAEPDEQDVTYAHWAALLLDVVCEHLDDSTRSYIAMRQMDYPNAVIAYCLGVSEQAVKNQYGGEKLAKKVRAATRRMVLGLPEQHRRLLARHLLEEAGLTHEQVRALLGVALVVDESVPVLEEEPLLMVLGWEPEKCRECWATARTARSMSLKGIPRFSV